MTTKTLEEQFHHEMVDLYKKTGRETGYWAHRYLQKVKRVGGLQAAHDWLNPKIDSTSGLQRLLEKNRIDLSFEALVLQEVDPIEDLRPVCPNCHAMIHLGGVTRSIKDVKAMLKQ